MCFGPTGTDKPIKDVPVPPKVPLPQPQAAPMPTDVSPQQTAEQRRNRISALKFGAMSTIRTSPQGTTGAGPDLTTPVATSKTKVGS